MVHNQFLITELKNKIIEHNLQIDCQSLHDHGLDGDFIESLLMAYLGFCVHQKRSVDLSYCAFNPAQTVAVIPGQIAIPVWDIILLLNNTKEFLLHFQVP